MLSGEVTKHIKAAVHAVEKDLADLEQQRAHIDAKVRQMQAMRDSLKALAVNGAAQNGHSDLLPFAGLSVRFSILKLFVTEHPGQLSRTEIANRLQRGGATTKGTDFKSNVSAVLSQMSSEDKQEMIQMENGWNITSKGIQEWRGFLKKRDEA